MFHCQFFVALDETVQPNRVRETARPHHEAGVEFSSRSKVLPHFALLDRVHPGSGLALEISSEIWRVGEGADDPKSARRVDPGLDPLLQGLGPVLGAPGVGSRHPEQLLLRQADTRQPGFDSMPGLPPTCSAIYGHD